VQGGWALRDVAQQPFGEPNRLTSEQATPMITVPVDLRHAVRVHAKNPGATAIAVFTLALAIGATTAIFSVVYGVLLRPLPYPASDRLMAI
jgi:hypothetical protein